eukprot:GEZU01025740.1.p1 GENE.GEZU01025740.1~~GEZU01025740.1.p1  ORF type:complete len:454 (+),score=124.60 GEZU01025740.1:114-1475(+)
MYHLQDTPLSPTSYYSGSFNHVDISASSPYASRGLHNSKYKIINDPIHGHIRIGNEFMQIIDTPQFQRLRDLKQLGSCYYVFPGASHNRFEHCVGVCHLAGVWLDILGSKDPDLEITPREQYLVQTAALCHDIGHGPFSHVFDNEFIPRAKPGYKWKHEDGSVMMLQHMIDDNNLDFEKEDINFLTDLIIGNQPSNKNINDKKLFLHQIVSNSQNSIDVDKFDYLARDSYNLGMKSSYDFSRLINFSRVVNNEICFHAKEVYNLYEMFHTRYSLHKQVYTHRVGKAIEYMITDALLLADPYMKISDSILDAEEYCTMTDSVLKVIERSKGEELKASRDLIRRLRKRDLYKYVDEILLPPSSTASVPKMTEQDVANCQDPNSNLNADDLIIHDLRINYALKDKNPVDHVHFFKNWDDTASFSIKKEQVSLLIPDNFQERYIRLYCRDPAKVNKP